MKLLARPTGAQRLSELNDLVCPTGQDPPFEQKRLSPPLSNLARRYVESITNEWSAACSGMLKAIFRIGKELLKAKSELEHGQFLAMIESELPFGRLTAWRFMTRG